MTNSLPFQIPTKNIIQVKIILNCFSTQIIIDKFILHLRARAIQFLIFFISFLLIAWTCYEFVINMSF